MEVDRDDANRKRTPIRGRPRKPVTAGGAVVTRSACGCRVEFHGDGQARFLERTDDPNQAQSMLTRHADALRAAGALGRLVLLDEGNGQVLARRQVRPVASTRGARRAGRSGR
jgi:hypothetical protein